MGFLSISCGPNDPAFLSQKPTLPNMYSPTLLTLNSLCLPLPSAFQSGLACLRSLAARGGVGGSTKDWVFFSPAAPLSWAPGAEGFLVSSLEQGTKPSPAWPHSGHSWDCVSLETGWLRGAHAISVCLHNWSVFTYLQINLGCRACVFSVCVFPCLCISACSSSW